MIGSRLPPVTIGIPFYNAERFLLNAIRSVFAQTHEDWELILMDDGSSDRSLEIAHSIADPRVRVFSDGENKKLAARLNEISSLAKHDFIARMDADDLMASDRIEKQLTFLQHRAGCDLVTSGVCSITDDLAPYGIRVPREGHVLTPYTVLSGTHGITHASIVGRKEWFLRNPYDPSDHRAEDYRLWVRAIRRNDLSVGFISEPLYYYREEGSMTPLKMLKAKRAGREVVLANGPGMMGWLPTVFLLTRSALKSIIILGAAAIGSTDIIVRARNSDFHAAALELVREDIYRALEVRVPLGGVRDVAIQKAEMCT